MLNALNGLTIKPALERIRHIAAAKVVLPAPEDVPRTSIIGFFMSH
jgi:hypothetical protein